MPISTDPNINNAYQFCQNLAKRHYENFPVASILLPKNIRYPIAAIYAFARTADDFADEGEQDAAQRSALLSGYEEELEQINAAHTQSSNQPSSNKIFVALSHCIKTHQLPLQNFRDLLSAFQQDVNTIRYQNFDEVLDYCSRSANPIGRLLLKLHGQATDKNIQLSDSICTALQLINFLQDIYQDIQENNRIYIPVDEMRQFNVTESQLKQRVSDQNMGKLFKLQLHRAQRLMQQGSALGQNIDGRFGLQLRLMIAGGLAICQRLERLEADYFERPRLRRRDWFAMFKYAIIRKNTLHIN